VRTHKQEQWQANVIAKKLNVEDEDVKSIGGTDNPGKTIPEM